MSTTTTRNALVKPAYTDAADIAVINTNYDTIDASFAKCNWAGTAAPAVTDDGTKGYSIGSIWFDTTNHKIYIAETVGTGTATWRQIYAAGSTNALLADGSVALTGNWNAGTKSITTTSTVSGSQIISTIADGTKPFDVTSKTVSTNLNADMLDGLHDTSFVKQTLADAKGDLIVASAADTWAREAVGADGYTLTGDASATNGVSWQPHHSGYMANMIINGDFVINQTGLATYTSTTVPANSDDTYLFDQWTLLSDGNDIMDCWRSTAAWPGSQQGSRASCLLQTETANKKAGIIQFLSNIECRAVIGGVVSLSFWAMTMASYPNANIMAGVLSWSSTADTLTSDVVSSWEATNTAPTLVANWTYENVPARMALVNDTWTQYKIENISIDTASTTNIAVFIWLDDTDSTVDDRLYITGVQLNAGPTCLPYSAPDYATQLALCKRYMMIWNSDAAAYGHVGTCAANDTEYAYIEWPHSTAWFKTAAAMTLTGSLALFDAVVTESLLSTIVIRVQDTAKGLTAGHSYVVYANNDTTMRVTGTSRL